MTYHGGKCCVRVLSDFKDVAMTSHEKEDVDEPDLGYSLKSHRKQEATAQITLD